MNCAKLCGILQTLAHEGHALAEVDDVHGKEIIGASLQNGKVVLLLENDMAEEKN